MGYITKSTVGWQESFRRSGKKEGDDFRINVNESNVDKTPAIRNGFRR